MSLLPKLGNSDNLVLDLDVLLQVPSQTTAPSSSPYVDVHIRNTFAPHERHVVSLRTQVPGHSQGDLVMAFVPYLVRSQADLRDIFYCNVERRAEHVRQRH